MFKSIVVGTDGSPRSSQAVAAAADLAQVHGAELHLVHAYRPTLSTLPGVGMAGDTMAVAAIAGDDELHAHVQQQLDGVAKEMGAQGLEVSTHVCPQAAAAAILRVAEEQSADLVVVGSKGMQGARRVLGSVPNSIAHQATCAVLIVHTG